MSLLTLNQVSLAYGQHPLLDRVDLQVENGERIALIGRNGTGKSTLFRVISGTATPDDGEVRHRDGLRVSHLEQEVPQDSDATIYDTVASGLGDLGRQLAEYHQLTGRVGAAIDREALARLAALQQGIEALNGWTIDNRIDTVLTRLGLPASRPLSSCSGGLRRQVMLARALVGDPDLLLLDEPTNHMDIAAIGWLEEYLLAFRGALIFISHDRTLVRRIATRIIELDRGRLTSFPGDYDRYLGAKEELLAAEARAAEQFDRRLAEHEAWLRQGVKARRTRNEGRVRRLLQMRRERAERLARPDKVVLEGNPGEQSGRRVVDLRHVSFSYAGHPVVRDLSTTVMRGDRIGIIGPNGCGKSTLLRLILGELEPDSGEVVHGSRLQLAYFDQHREQLDPAKSVRDNISDGTDYVTVRGRSRHVAGYLKDFLFPPQRLDSPVGILSGGERNRLLLARLFTQPANMLVMDEPTNDLDVETLELLEDLLADFDGTLLLVSHDRTFIDNVVTSTLVFEGDGRVGEYVGGYEDWVRQRRPPTPQAATGPAPGAAATDRAGRARARAPAPRRLSYRERQELETLPARIEAMETELTALEMEAAGAGFYQKDKETITAALARLEALRAEIAASWERWEALDRKDKEAAGPA